MLKGLCFFFFSTTLYGAAASSETSIVDQILDAVDSKQQRGNLRFLPRQTLLARSWIVLSEFDYDDPSRDLLNVAYPSAIASYFVTIVPKNSRYIFKGTFPTSEGIYQMNLLAYDEQGDLDSSVPSLDRYYTSPGEEVHMDVQTSEQPRLIIQRYYVDPDMYSDADIEAMLFNVTKKTKFLELSVPPLPRPLRTILSNLLEGIIAQAITTRAPVVTSDTPTEFALPGDTSSLFPNPSNVYLFAILGPAPVVQITGTFNVSSIRPYFDFMVVNQNTTATDDALPFYEFIDSDGSYTLTAASESYDGPVSNATIRWKSDNRFPLVIMRFITYDFNVTNYTGPLSPEQTQQLIPDIYPSVNYTTESLTGLSLLS